MMRAYFIAYLIVYLLGISSASAQSIRLDNLREQFGKGKPYKFNGALSANTIYYAGNGGYGRDPFSYFVNGSMVLNLYGLVNLPFTFTLSNLAEGYTLPIPRNRFSLHPTYKSITGHIGDISTTYSPYTINGYLFSGAGVDVQGNKPLKVSTIYGRLQKAVPYDSTSTITQAAYERWGYGAKIMYEQNLFKVGMIMFHARDEVNSLEEKPDSLQIYPMENTVLSLLAGARFLQRMNLTMEYATSALTDDVRAPENSSSTLLGKITTTRESTGYYGALKASLQYTLQSTLLGVGYERVDPGYRTLGAYFLNNDMENITMNAVQPLFQGKLQLAFNAGFQRDNLNQAKSGRSSRFISSANVSYSPSQKITVTGSYSNFQTFMRILPQFRTINRLDNFQNMDTLNYTQVSQNANVSVNYILSQSEDNVKTLNGDISFQETADQQGNVISNGNLSRFYNGSLLYSTSRMKEGNNFSAGFNITYNTIGRDDFVTIGPLVNLSRGWFQKKLVSGINLSYNTSSGTGTINNQVMNIRLNTVYKVQKRHAFTLNVLHQWRASPGRSTNDVTLTCGYNFILG